MCGDPRTLTPTTPNAFNILTIWIIAHITTWLSAASAACLCGQVRPDAAVRQVSLNFSRMSQIVLREPQVVARRQNYNFSHIL